MFNNYQVEKFVADLGLSYEWIEGSTSTIVVENVIEFKPFSCWVTDLRTGQKYHATSKFRELCKELASSK